MPKSVEVFTPNDLPSFSYVERASRKFEEQLHEALSIPKMVISLSGPSKSGKTVLVNRAIESENLIPISGASVQTADDLWNRVLAWMEVPSEQVETTGSKSGAKADGKAGGKIKVPLVAEGKAEAGVSVSGEKSRATTKKFTSSGLAQVVKEIANSDFVVFVDDFHYIPKASQKKIGKQIKEATESGVRICTASVPHRSDDVVRSNTELRGRVVSIDTDYWKRSELEQIAYRGFHELNIDVAPSVLKELASEAFGSPQLMQAICLNFCFENKIFEMLPEQTRIEAEFVMQQRVLERTSAMTDFSSMIAALHSGPRQRGQERKVFSFTDGSKGDVYRCVLLAMKADPPRLAFPYDEMLTRTAAVSVGESPVGSSVAQALSQMEKIAETVQDAPVIEWDEDVLDIVEPYFLFFLRCSTYLQSVQTS